MAKKPNVILITVDALRADHLGFMGYQKNISPNLDELAKESSVFTQAFAAGPTTPYSFPSILTSTYSLDYQGPLKIDRPRRFINEILKERGFVTAAVHSNPLLSGYFGYNRGWDYFEDLSLSKIKRGIKGRIRSWIRPAERISHAFFPEFFFRIRFLIYKFNKLRTDFKTKASSVNQIAKDFIQAAKEDSRPFFLWIHYMDVHGPYIPYLNITTGKPLSYSETVVKSLPSFLQSSFFKTIAKGFIKKYLNKMIDLYDDGIKYVDEQIGDLISSLKKENFYENTIICLTSDHGDEFLEHGGASHTSKLYDELLRVPLLIKSPEGQAQLIAERKVSLIDVPTTICDLLGIERDPTHKGANLFEGSDSPIFHQAAIQPKGRRFRDTSIKSINQCLTACHFKEWKYIINHSNGKEELYNLSRDPKEQNNLSESQPEVLSRAKREVKNFMEKNPPLSLVKKESLGE